MAISANLGQDTDHNSTKLVCSHPLTDRVHWPFSTRRNKTKLKQTVTNFSTNQQLHDEENRSSSFLNTLYLTPFATILVGREHDSVDLTFVVLNMLPSILKYRLTTSGHGVPLCIYHHVRFMLKTRHLHS